VVDLEVIEKSLHVLKKGNVFVVLEVKGKRGEKISLAEQKISGEVIFFHESPKTMHNCVYFPDKKVIELGGAEMETERTIYLVVC
jgi:Holliday junction resolvase